MAAGRDTGAWRATHAGKWEVMLHGPAFGQFLYEPGEKHRTGGFGSRQVSSVNWLMAWGAVGWVQDVWDLARGHAVIETRALPYVYADLGSLVQTA